MSQLIHFTKMHGAGNDFVVLDCIRHKIDINTLPISSIAKRHTGIGFDQLLIIEPPSNTAFDFKYRIFNADGNEVEQCGNGARCFAHYVNVHKLSTKKAIQVETAKGSIVLSITEKRIRVDMGLPDFAPKQIPLLVDSQQLTYDFIIDDIVFPLAAISMGNPHVVYISDNINNGEFEIWAPKLRNHVLLPEQANVSFMQIIDRDHIKLRVLERGVGETLACGSGACAAVVAGISQGLLNHEVAVELAGGTLYIEWQPDKSVIQTGPAKIVFEGTILVP